MTFKTKPHRYTIGLAPTSRARCRGCRKSVGKGSLRLAIHAFVRPNRGTTFTHHLTPECVGTALAADVVRARGVPCGVNVDVGLEPEAVVCAWEELEAQTGKSRVSECSRQSMGAPNGRLAAPTNPLSARCFDTLAGLKSAEASTRKMRDVRKRG